MRWFWIWALPPVNPFTEEPISVKLKYIPILCPDPPSCLHEINSVGANSWCRGRKGHISVLKAFPGPLLFSTHVGILLCLGGARGELSWSEQGAGYLSWEFNPCMGQSLNLRTRWPLGVSPISEYSVILCETVNPEPGFCEGQWPLPPLMLQQLCQLSRTVPGQVGQLQVIQAPPQGKHNLFSTQQSLQ